MEREKGKQGRKKGDVGVVSVRYQDVRAVLGDEFNGFIDVRKSWFDSMIKPQCEMVMVKSNELANGVRPIEIETVVPLIAPPKRPTQSLDIDNI